MMSENEHECQSRLRRSTNVRELRYVAADENNFQSVGHNTVVGGRGWQGVT
jgi:hypothetical protein